MIVYMYSICVYMYVCICVCMPTNAFICESQKIMFNILLCPSPLYSFEINSLSLHLELGCPFISLELQVWVTFLYEEFDFRCLCLYSKCSYPLYCLPNTSHRHFMSLKFLVIQNICNSDWWKIIELGRVILGVWKAMVICFFWLGSTWVFYLIYILWVLYLNYYISQFKFI